MMDDAEVGEVVSISDLAIDVRDSFSVSSSSGGGMDGRFRLK
jgi:hypothetical protein